MDTQEAKNEILARIKSGKPRLMTLPEVPRFGWPGNPLENFIKMLLGFDGRAVKFANRADAVRWLTAQPEMDMAQNVVYSSAKDVEGNMSEEQLTDLHETCSIETCVSKRKWEWERPVLYGLLTRVLVMRHARCSHDIYSCCSTAQKS